MRASRHRNMDEETSDFGLRAELSTASVIFISNFSFLFSRGCGIAIALLVLTVWPGMAQEKAAPAAEETVEMRTYRVRYANYEELGRHLSNNITASGRIILLPKQGKVIVREVPSNFPVLETLIRELDVAAPRIRVEVTLRETGQTTDRRVSVGGQATVGRDPSVTFRGGKYHVKPVEQNVLEVDARDQSGTSSSLASQFITTMSGHSASLVVGEDVPLVKYWQYYLAQYQTTIQPLPGGGAVTQTTIGYLIQPDIIWTQVGTSLEILPVLNGDLIEVQVTPVISVLANSRWETVQLKKLSTTVVVKSGATVQIGGFSKGGDEFNRNFFSYGRRGETLSGTFTLKATLEEPRP